MSGWNVRRTWWEFTKLVQDLPGGARQAFERHDWLAVRLSWVGGGDRYATLVAEPEVDSDA